MASEQLAVAQPRDRQARDPGRARHDVAQGRDRGDVRLEDLKRRQAIRERWDRFESAITAVRSQDRGTPRSPRFHRRQAEGVREAGPLSTAHPATQEGSRGARGPHLASGYSACVPGYTRRLSQPPRLASGRVVTWLRSVRGRSAGRRSARAAASIRRRATTGWRWPTAVPQADSSRGRSCTSIRTNESWASAMFRDQDLAPFLHYGERWEDWPDPEPRCWERFRRWRQRLPRLRLVRP